MTKYLNPQPFSGPTSNGRMTADQYDIAVGLKEFCYDCMKCVPRPHVCPEIKK
ncbi:MAG TPA: hypothetical protein VI386_17905 [Candidatus Sulfotelmatobacter sp.]